YYLEAFYHEQGTEHTDYVTEHYLQHLAHQVPNLNQQLWANDRHDPLLNTQVTADEHAALAANLYDTPSFLVGDTGSTPTHRLGETATAQDIDEAIQQTLHPISKA
ncbi:MAG TPA: hypothetical protein VGF95_12595, partial [Solirubrobacteraceae bacterium]